MDLTTTDPTKLVPRQTMQKRTTLSLHHLQRAHSGTGKTVILADISGSMSGHKLSCLQDALDKVWCHGVTGIAFNSQLYSFSRSDIFKLYARGTTDMLGALQEAWKTAADHIILLTDGQPDGGASEIVSVVTDHPTPPIDTIGIGADCDHTLLQDISRLTHGRYNDVQDPLQLTNTIRLMLDFRPDDLTMKGGSIAL
jgi:hypothetical protein